MYDLNGDWDILIQFIRGAAQHSLRFEQDGETLKGIYRSQYGTQELQGSVRGNEVQIQTNLRHESQGASYLFKGIINGDEIHGTLGLGEYWQATWKAKKR